MHSCSFTLLGQVIVLDKSLNYHSLFTLREGQVNKFNDNCAVLSASPNQAHSRSYTENSCWWMQLFQWWLRRGANIGRQLHPQSRYLFCKDPSTKDTFLSWLWGELASISATHPSGGPAHLPLCQKRTVSLYIQSVCWSFLCPWLMQQYAVSFLSPDSWDQWEGCLSLLMFRRDSGI